MVPQPKGAIGSPFSTGGFDPAATAAALGLAAGAVALTVLQPYEWLNSWWDLADLFASTWILIFCLTLPALWLVQPLLNRNTPWGPKAGRGTSPRATDPAPEPDPRPGLPPGSAGGGIAGGKGAGPRAPALARGRTVAGFAGVLLLICALELATHSGERNGFVASSRPDLGVERWTTADGYTTLLDGIPAQGDGLALLPLLRLFRAEGAPEPSEFDRRAGHLYLVALLVTPFGTYWGFSVLNLLAWWLAALTVWWLGQRRWPGSMVPWIAALLVATGLGFIFMGAAPQAHAAAFAAFALVLALADRLDLWGAQSPGGAAPDRHGWRAGALTGWAAGAAGLIYFTYIPSLTFAWLYGVRARRWIALATASVVALGLVLSWERGGATIGLSFGGGNNDLAGEALRGWAGAATTGVHALIGQLHHSSLRGILVAAFYYPWWLLAALGYWKSTPEARRWALAVLLAGALPAIAFSTRFSLPRVAYFMFPAMYLLGARGIEWLVDHPLRQRASSTGRIMAALGCVALLAALTNADLVGIQQLNLWFHLAQGNRW